MFIVMVYGIKTPERTDHRQIAGMNKGFEYTRASNRGHTAAC
jgi:hypothetical protein